MTTFTNQLSAALFDAITLKYNENHDELGRFSEGDSGGSSSETSIENDQQFLKKYDSMREDTPAGYTSKKIPNGHYEIAANDYKVENGVAVRFDRVTGKIDPRNNREIPIKTSVDRQIAFNGVQPFYKIQSGGNRNLEIYRDNKATQKH